MRYLFVIVALWDVPGPLGKGIGQWNGFRVNITEEPSDGGKGDQHERTCRSDDQGVEDSWLLMRGPAKVSERS